MSACRYATISSAFVSAVASTFTPQGAPEATRLINAKNEARISYGRFITFVLETCWLTLGRKIGSITASWVHTLEVLFCACLPNLHHGLSIIN